MKYRAVLQDSQGEVTDTTWVTSLSAVSEWANAHVDGEHGDEVLVYEGILNALGDWIDTELVDNWYLEKST